ncbi:MULTISPECIES: glycosyltransferase family 2 protein [unclassified Paenibacillus]|uniref:glycosyltransferase family 2 protein n=1 Tax=unclassified Paenibacillus TaxID=185978 RepID=UPI00278771CA|nr:MULTISPECIES: glycosyltransferase family A protein [unclassified Paenibacillus]MDQ0897079.1 glycosyltransferase involved in cell wall biosynthesis [Paenibacillus sp. V4I7]MDQ0916771.1 glycosyltransferase involved in cell wall biosynthesis [Paenibacillus sp. V4I5]
MDAENEGVHVKNTIESALRVKTAYPFEIIVVDDGSSDGCCDFIASNLYGGQVRVIQTDGIGAAMARNKGADQAIGKYFYSAMPIYSLEIYG